jgi:acetyl-CoA synthetase
MSAELPITMLACARLGVIHSQVFGGFSGKACADRIVDSGSNVLITMDSYYRSGKLLDHKQKSRYRRRNAAEGRPGRWTRCWSGSAIPESIRRQPRWLRAGTSLSTTCLKNYYGARVEPVPMNGEDPLFLMYTSGTTGKPKGCQHGTGGYLAYVTGTSKYVQDIHPEDVYWCMADIGWITGHSYIVYGPLSLRLDGHLRRNSHLSGCRALLAHRPGPGCQHLPHRAHGHSRPAQNRPGRTGQVQLPLQTHDHRGRAHRAGSVEVVPQGSRQR